MNISQILMSDTRKMNRRILYIKSGTIYYDKSVAP